jgi:2-phosphoglycerate kinase
VVGRTSLCQAGWCEPDCVYLWEAGGGKSSLAFPLAAELGYSLVTEDLVKEALRDALYVRARASSTGLGRCG